MAESPHHHVARELQWGLSKLREAGADTPQLDAELLLAHVIGLSRTSLIAHPDRRLSDREHQEFHRLIERRSDRYPLPYLIGKKEFWGLEFEVNPSVLIPRPETELLVEAACEWLRGRPTVIADIGAGSGAIAVALAKELSQSKVYATEIAPEAAATAARNADKHSVADRVKIIVGDLMQPLRDEGLAGRLDAIVSNPPYISSEAWDTMQPEVKYEPRGATIAGPDPLHFYRRIIAESVGLLKPGGRILLEVDPGQPAPIAEFAASHGMKYLETRLDLAGLERIAILECVS